MGAQVCARAQAHPQVNAQGEELSFIILASSIISLIAVWCVLIVSMRMSKWPNQKIGCMLVRVLKNTCRNRWVVFGNVALFAVVLPLRCRRIRALSYLEVKVDSWDSSADDWLSQLIFLSFSSLIMAFVVWSGFGFGALLLPFCIPSLAVYRLIFHPFAKFPSPKIAAVTSFYECAYDLFVAQGGEYINEVHRLHQKYD